jgi:hypothetical protein
MNIKLLNYCLLSRIETNKTLVLFSIFINRLIDKTNGFVFLRKKVLIKNIYECNKNFVKKIFLFSINTFHNTEKLELKFLIEINRP